tara:strand:- start:5866 stop:6318 length:453 start_codon:yes stop_codon:yes gene_type:complete
MKVIVRKLKDIHKKFSKKEKVKKILKKKNPEIYRVYVKKLDGDFVVGKTVIKPGQIGGEYYMTKGHRHKIQIPEVYILEKGKGNLILQNKKAKMINMKKNIPIIIPGKSAHRLVNTGKNKLEVLTIYSKKSGHSYNVKFKKKVVKNESNE